MEPKKERIACIQWLRIFAAAAVVVMHTAAVVWNRTPMDAAPWKILTVYDALVRWPVPVFAMITGALFLPRKTELKTVLKRYIPRMLFLFVLWSGLYVRYRYLHGLPAEKLWLEFANGQNGHGSSHFSTSFTKCKGSHGPSGLVAVVIKRPS